MPTDNEKAKLCKEFQEEAQIIINTAIQRIANMGFGLTTRVPVRGDVIMVRDLTVKRLPKVQQ